MTYLKECITELTNYLVDDVPDRDLVGVRIRNTENLQDKLLGISFRRRDQMKPDLIWAVLSKVIQSNARFGLTDAWRFIWIMLEILLLMGNRQKGRKGGH